MTKGFIPWVIRCDNLEPILESTASHRLLNSGYYYPRRNPDPRLNLL